MNDKARVLEAEMYWSACRISGSIGWMRELDWEWSYLDCIFQKLFLIYFDLFFKVISKKHIVKHKRDNFLQLTDS